MQIKCPHCAAQLEVTVNSAVYSPRGYIVNLFFEWLKGVKPDRGYFKQIDQNEFEYFLQIYDSPDGDIWERGIIEWLPGRKLEFKKKEERGA